MFGRCSCHDDFFFALTLAASSCVGNLACSCLSERGAYLAPSNTLSLGARADQLSYPLPPLGRAGRELPQSSLQQLHPDTQ